MIKLLIIISLSVAASIAIAPHDPAGVFAIIFSAPAVIAGMQLAVELIAPIFE